MAIPDVEICETDTENCALTDAEGSATLQLPVGEEISITLEKEGYQSYLVAAVVPAEPPVLTMGLATVERIEFLHGLVMSPYPMEGTGDLIVVSSVLGPFPGITLELGEATGNGFYYDEKGNWDADLTETSSFALGPWGGFTEVSPGEVQVKLGGTAAGCIALAGWPGDVDNSVRMLSLLKASSTLQSLTFSRSGSGSPP